MLTYIFVFLLSPALLSFLSFSLSLSLSLSLVCGCYDVLSPVLFVMMCCLLCCLHCVAMLVSVTMTTHLQKKTIVQSPHTTPFAAGLMLLWEPTSPFPVWWKTTTRILLPSPRRPAPPARLPCRRCRSCRCPRRWLARRTTELSSCPRTRSTPAPPV